MDIRPSNSKNKKAAATKYIFFWSSWQFRMKKKKQKKFFSKKFIMNTFKNQFKDASKLQTKKMTICRFLGYVQTDGNINFGFDAKHMTFHPKITMTTSLQNSSLLLEVIKPFLQSYGINSSTQKRVDISGETMNLSIERQVNINKFIFLIEKEIDEAKVPTLLVDDKLFQYNALKKAIELNALRKDQTTRTSVDQLLCQIIDLKVYCSLLKSYEKNYVLSNKSKQKLKDIRRKQEVRCNVENSFACAGQIIEDLKAKTNQQCQDLLDFLTKNPYKKGESNAKRNEFFMGVFEGDGSFQLAILTRGEKFAGYLPLVTVTDGYVYATKEHYVFLIVNAYFQSLSRPTKKNSKAQAQRIYVKSRLALTNIVYFCLETKFVNRNYSFRFCVFEFALIQSEEILASYENAIFVLDQIYQFFDLRFLRKTKEERVEEIQKFFNL